MATSQPALFRESREYYDILLIGRMGMGKSTTGNKMLYDASEAADSDEFTLWALDGRDDDMERSPQFKESEYNSVESTGGSCQLISNDLSMLRILDTPGFQVSNKQANLSIMHQILHMQIYHHLVFKRVLYFLPVRGPLERADTILEEIKLIKSFFGRSIFEIMIVVATLHPRFASLGFHDEDKDLTKKALWCAFDKVFHGESDQATPVAPKPPLLYIAFDDFGNKIFEEVKHIVQSQDGLKLNAQVDTCARCAVRIYDVQGERFCVGYDNVPVVYDESFCHPVMVPKYSKFEKISGSLANVATLGIPYALGVRWPNFLNFEESCVVCKGAPGERGCTKVLQNCKISTGKSTVHILADHMSQWNKKA